MEGGPFWASAIGVHHEGTVGLHVSGTTALGRAGGQLSCGRDDSPQTGGTTAEQAEKGALPLP